MKNISSYSEKAQKSKLESRCVENYRIDDKRKDCGKDDQWIREKMAKVPASYRSRAYKSFRGEISPLQAVRAMCEQCIGYTEVKEAIGKCTAYTCPLWAYRPYQDSSDQDGET